MILPVHHSLSKMLCKKFLKYSAKCTLFYCKFFGFWPYYFDSKSKQFKTKWYFLPYLAILLICLLFAHTASSHIIMATIRQEFASPFTNILVMLYTTLFFCYIITIVLMQYKRLKPILRLIPQLELFLHNSSQFFGPDAEPKYPVKALVFGLKCFVLPITQGFVNIQKILNLSLAVRRCQILAFLMVSPILLAFIIPTIFLGGAICIWLMLEKINKHLNNKMDRMLQLCGYECVGKHNLNSKYSRMKQFCDLSDYLDELAIVRLRLFTLSRYFMRIFEFQIVFWLAHKFAELLLNMHFLYMFMKYIFVRKTSADSSNVTYMFILNLIDVICVKMDIFLAANVCKNIKQEV